MIIIGSMATYAIATQDMVLLCYSNGPTTIFLYGYLSIELVLL